MRHFFGYLSDGALTSMETYNPGGWPICDCSPGCPGLSNPDCKNSLSTSLRKSRAVSRPDIVGYVLYDCPCPPEMGQCDSHVSVVYGASMVVDGELVDKPMTTHYINGEPIEADQVLSRPPGTELEYMIAAPGIPDGTKVICFQGTATWVAPEPEWEMVFTDGQTPTKTLIVPAQGALGIVTAAGSLARGIRFKVLGWAVS